jgi:hypothetical protein
MKAVLKRMKCYIKLRHYHYFEEENVLKMVSALEELAVK